MSNFFDRYATGGATRPDSFTGMNPAFASALTQMFTDAPPNIQHALRVSSGYRSFARQKELFDASDRSGHMVARPGHSQHNHGMAADLQYLDPASREWAQQNAAKYGLAFPMSYEPWHIELAGARGQKGAPVAVASAGPTASPAPTPAGASPMPTPFGDLVAPPPVTPAAAPPGVGEAVAAFMQSRRDRDAAAAAEQARRQALFGGLGSLYG